jgi:hypothetical protein
MRRTVETGKKRDGINVMFFTVIVLCTIVVVFFIIGYEIGNTVI